MRVRADYLCQCVWLLIQIYEDNDSTELIWISVGVCLRRPAGASSFTHV